MNFFSSESVASFSLDLAQNWHAGVPMICGLFLGLSSLVPAQDDTIIAGVSDPLSLILHGQKFQAISALLISQEYPRGQSLSYADAASRHLQRARLRGVDGFGVTMKTSDSIPRRRRR